MKTFLLCSVYGTTHIHVFLACRCMKVYDVLCSEWFVLSKQMYLQNFQERCAQHGAFQRTTRNIKHRTTSYIGTLKTRVFWSKRAQIESKNHDNVVNIVLYWTFLGLSAPYEVAERSCAIFCILIYFTGYKINMCVGTESVTVFNAVTGFSLVWGLRLWLARNRNYSWIWWGDGR